MCLRRNFVVIFTPLLHSNGEHFKIDFSMNYYFNFIFFAQSNQPSFVRSVLFLRLVFIVCRVFQHYGSSHKWAMLLSLTTFSTFSPSTTPSPSHLFFFLVQWIQMSNDVSRRIENKNGLKLMQTILDDIRAHLRSLEIDIVSRPVCRCCSHSRVWWNMKMKYYYEITRETGTIMRWFYWHLFWHENKIA